ncbi:hypothetical protein WMF38_26820 [Sorangium sp. So ce118]
MLGSREHAKTAQAAAFVPHPANVSLTMMGSQAPDAVASKIIAIAARLTEWTRIVTDVLAYPWPSTLP